MRLQIDVAPPSNSTASAIRAITRNVSPHGLYFETPCVDLKAGSTIDVQLTVPPGEGYFPYAGRVNGTAEILRVDLIPGYDTTPARIGVAARFSNTLKLVF